MVDTFVMRSRYLLLGSFVTKLLQQTNVILYLYSRISKSKRHIAQVDKSPFSIHIMMQ